MENNEKSENSDKTCFVSGPLGYILRVSQIFGIAPLHFTKSGVGWRVRVSPILNIYSKVLVVTICVISIIIIWFYYETSVHPKQDDRAGRILFFTECCVAIIFTVVSAFTGSQRMQRTIAGLNRIEEINNKLSIDHPQVSLLDKMKWKFSLFTLIGGFIASLWDFVITITEKGSNGGFFLPFVQVFYMLIYYMRLTMQTQFILTANTIVLSFKRLNECLKNLQRFMENDSGVNQPSKPLTQALHQLASFHDCLSDVTRHVDDANGFLLTIFIAIHLMGLTACMYLIIGCFIASDTNVISYSNFYLFMWWVVHVCGLLSVIEPCHETIEEVEITKHIVSKMMLIAVMRSNDIFKAVERFYKYLILVRVAYAPMKIFTLNRALLLTIFSAITTYLVIVIQNRQ